MEIDDDQLKWEHWNVGGAMGSVRVTHLPTGVSVSRDCEPTVPVLQIHALLLRELELALAHEA